MVPLAGELSKQGQVMLVIDICYSSLLYVENVSQEDGVPDHSTGSC